MDKKEVGTIKENFEPLFGRVLGIVIYGSLAKGDYSERSDIDLCIIAPGEDNKKLYRETLPLNYDIPLRKLWRDQELRQRITTKEARYIFN